MRATDARDVVVERLRRQRLCGVPFDAPEDVVRWLGAVQSQDVPGAMWGIGQRVASGTEASVGRAIDEGRIVRTHVLRPTWHFVTPADLRSMLALTGPRLIARGARRRGELGLDDRTLRRALSAIERALRGGRARTRREVGEALSRSRIDPTGQRLPHLLMHAELEGLVCGGPRQGRDHTYVLLDDVVPVAPAVDRSSALAELARRYFAGHGPAGIADFSWWAGLTVADCRSAIDGAGPALDSRSLEGVTLWSVPPRPRGSAIRPRVRLLPHFDEYLIAYRERAMYGPALGSSPWPPATVGGHTLVIDGILAGTWRQRPTAAGVAVEVTLARTVEPATRSEIRSAAEDLGRYVGTGLDSVTISR